MKQLLIGNAAIARGLYEAGCRFVSSYPGTPSTEITEYAATYPEVYAEWAANEKVSLEASIGASLAGARAFSAMKHVGLNVAADPLFTVSYSGVNGGLVIAVADDPGMHSSQNEQDSRNYAHAAKVPMLEPSDSAECRDFTTLAFELSERFDVPVFVRLTTRIAHSQSLVEPFARTDVALKEYEKNPAKYVMAPASARARRVVLEKRAAELLEYSETSPLNRVEHNSKKIGIITAGDCYQYAREAFGEQASYLKLGMVYPLPVELIRGFAQSVDTLYIVEEQDDFIETHCKKFGIKCIGKEKFTPYGEYTVDMLRRAVLGDNSSVDAPTAEAGLAARPPVLCPGCPHRGTFHVLSKLKLTVSGDIGCYTLGAAPPLGAMDATICMGASIGMAHGISKTRPDMSKNTVAVIGDSTFIHSGLTGLASAVYNGGTATIMVLDNSITAMTGHQHNPLTQQTLKGEPSPTIDIAAVCRALGVKRVREVDPFDLKGLETAVREETSSDELSVIVVKRPCVLLKHVEKKPAVCVNTDCVSCGLCMKIGCPAITMTDGGAFINDALCVGCQLCVGICPKKAIL